MFRSVFSAVVVGALASASFSPVVAQSSTRGSGTVITSPRSQGQIIYRSQPQQGQIIYQGAPGSTAVQRGPIQGSSRVTQVPQTFEDKFWMYLQASRYKNWSPVPGRTGDTYPGKSPHGAMLRMYLNRNAAGRPAELPNSSIIVKENYGPAGKKLLAITVMYKTTGYNPDAADWYWIKYRPDGKVDAKDTENGRVKLTGKPKGCIECHASAANNDFVFFNDPE